jgi:acyl-CoA synthetase (NDP forming)
VQNDLLNKLLKPESLAIIGASTQPGKIGYTVLNNLKTSGYDGQIYPVNPSATEILGYKTYPTITDIPGSVDSAVVVVPAKMVSEVIDECGQKGVKGLIIITSGFSEVGRKDLEDEIVEKAKLQGMRILGPNIVGYLSNSDKINASFAPFLPLPGKASLVSQSGALLIAIDASSYIRGVGFDKLISIGNMSDVDFADCVTWLNHDPKTSCISLYIEGFKELQLPRLIRVHLPAPQRYMGLHFNSQGSFRHLIWITCLTARLLSRYNPL